MYVAGLCVWGLVDLSMTPSSFQKGRGGVVSVFSKWECGMCSLDLWTMAENSKGKRGQLSAMCPEEAGVRCVRHKRVLGTEVSILHGREPESVTSVPAE